MSRPKKSQLRKRVLMALSYYDGQLHRGITRYAKEAGWILDTSMVHYGVPPQFWKGDGIITIFLPDRPEITDFLLAQHCSTVALYGDMEEIKVSRVLTDDYLVGQMAAQEFLDRRFEYMAFAKFTDLRAVNEREMGFRETVLKEGKKYILFDFRSKKKGSSTNWLSRLKHYIERTPKPIGLLAQSDHRANTLISGCDQLGIAVPNEVSIIGVDNNEHISDFASIPISSVDCQREQMAYQGAKLLDSLMKGNDAPTKPLIIKPTSVVVRQSSNHYAIKNHSVVRALQFIDNNYLKQIGVKDVVDASLTSRSGLYISFENYLHHSISEEISRRRIAYAIRLLLETSEPIHRIAFQSGFQSTENFCRVFKRLTGLQASKYRDNFLK